MSKFSDYARAVLLGGIPAAVDLGVSAGTKQGDGKPEQTAPATTIKDKDTSTASLPKANPLEFLDAKTVLIGIGGAILVAGVLFLSLKALGKK